MANAVGELEPAVITVIGFPLASMSLTNFSYASLKFDEDIGAIASAQNCLNLPFLRSKPPVALGLKPSTKSV